MHCSGHFKPILVAKGYNYKKGFRQSGQDRDAYIAVNNGGFTVSHQAATQVQPSTFYTAQRKVKYPTLRATTTSQPRNNTRSPIVIYQQDGTGRDMYIYANNGGFANVYKGSVGAQ